MGLDQRIGVELSFFALCRFLKCLLNQSRNQHKIEEIPHNFRLWINSRIISRIVESTQEKQSLKFNFQDCPQFFLFPRLFPNSINSQWLHWPEYNSITRIKKNSTTNDYFSLNSQNKHLVSSSHRGNKSIWYGSMETSINSLQMSSLRSLQNVGLLLSK